MDKSKALDYLLSTKLSPLLIKEEVTDISYNGEKLFYVSNIYGRKSYDVEYNEQEARDFIRQIANISGKQFSFSSPRLDVTIANYRINATHPSIGRVKDEERITFSIRIISNKIRLFDDEGFFNKEISKALEKIINERQSLVIGGLPGSGKSELQKYLLTKINSHQRVILIDNILELENIRDYINYDLTTWQFNENNSSISLQSLIRDALRNNPDWLILAEGRGKEMLDIIFSAITGLPIITTIHAIDVFSMPLRMARLACMGEVPIDYQDILGDIYHHFHYFAYVSRYISNKGRIIRYISDLIQLDNNGQLFKHYKYVRRSKDE